MKFAILLTIVVVVLVAAATAQRRPRCPQGARPPRCVGPRNVGSRCATAPPRTMWYYNQASRTCIQMPHLGCGGNANRWCSRAGCERRCLRTAG
ncbi:PI-actitoxin-Afv2b-like [Calliphora vicina]|uniref:PI-actitoxin-Afv2b-like n=1 Tax=Calliphora vicina TaxID=7373 RepID=UPI00325B3958